MEVISSCTGQERIWNEASAIYAKCFVMAGMIVSVHYLHCVREVNNIAHSLAKFAFDNNVLLIFFFALANDVIIMSNQ